MSVVSPIESPIIPVVMCGGSGTRLWPLSRVDRPKQFHHLFGDESMFKATLRRFSGPRFGRPYILVNKRFLDETIGQVAAMGWRPESVLIEPAIRNTAPALAAAALLIARRDPNALMLATPADHVVTDPDALTRAIIASAPAAREGHIVVFGITPTTPETGYGYLEAGEAYRGSASLFHAAFQEKPSKALAEAFVADGRHLWNAGLFLMSAGTLISEFERHAPEVLEAARLSLPVIDAEKTERVELVARAYAHAPSISIDYAVMEKSDKVLVAPVSPGWSDVGAWSALWDVQRKDADGNVGTGDAILSETTNSYVNASGGRLVAVHGVSDLVVVDTEDAVLVTRRDQAQGVKDIVERLAKAQRPEAQTPKRVERPWGSYQSINNGPGFQVKHIIVKPGGRLSLQFHYHRSEHWTVVAGTARVTVGDKVEILQPNESTYVPLGAVHRLENLGKVDLHMIEVQCGQYLGEDDIVRVDDVYGRSKAG